jgi:hypothetical protein
MLKGMVGRTEPDPVAGEELVERGAWRAVTDSGSTSRQGRPLRRTTDRPSAPTATPCIALPCASLSTLPCHAYLPFYPPNLARAALG